MFCSSGRHRVNLKTPHGDDSIFHSILSHFMNRKLDVSELNRPNLEVFKQSNRSSIRVILDNVRSLSNVGSIFRTCDAFNVELLMLCGITGMPPHRDIHKTALGATESVPWKHFPMAVDALTECKNQGYVIVSVEQCANTISPKEVSKLGPKVCLIFGSEVGGVDQQLIDRSDAVIEIPQAGTKHSLNVAVAAGIVIWEAYSAKS